MLQVVDPPKYFNGAETFKMISFFLWFLEKVLLCRGKPQIHDVCDRSWHSDKEMLSSPDVPVHLSCVLLLLFFPWPSQSVTTRWPVLGASSRTIWAASSLLGCRDGLCSSCCWSCGCSCREVLSGPFCAHWCGGEEGEVPTASSLILSSLRDSPFLLPPPSSSHCPVLTVPALHWWQLLSAVIRTEDVQVLCGFPPLRPADPFTRTCWKCLGVCQGG